ncbi:MAG: hypothetical protein US49_C0003G0043 [candidate division TM6 bacterium GW2011_GWF2_37_49]|nr:MAG: hypothetical protein US49_C0003G0043 [candidate division TM6 bacterium GW2011_GWF2_37_49]
MFKVFKSFYLLFLIGMLFATSNVFAMDDVEFDAAARFAADHPDLVSQIEADDGNIIPVMHFMQAHPETPEAGVYAAYKAYLVQPAPTEPHIPQPAPLTDSIVLQEPTTFPQFSAKDKEALDGIRAQLPAILQEAKQAKQGVQREFEDLKKVLSQGKSNEPIFSIPISNLFEVGFYKNDFAKFGFDFCDYCLDKFLFNQMQNYYKQSATRNMDDKVKLLIAELDKVDQEGFFSVLKEPAANDVFVNNCIKTLDVNFKLNLKWCLHIIFNLVCKHYLYEKEKQFMGGESFNFGYAATSVGDLINEIAPIIDQVKPALADPAAINPLLQDVVIHKIEGVIQKFQNKKLRVSAYPLISFLLFGRLPIDIRAEQVWQGVVGSIKLLGLYWFNGKKYNGAIDTLNSQYFIWGARILGFALFLRNIYKFTATHFKEYIKANIQLFLKILNDIRFASLSNKQSYADAEKALREFLKKGHEISFDYWKMQKNFGVNNVFGIVGYLSFWAWYGTIIYILARKA